VVSGPLPAKTLIEKPAKRAASDTLHSNVFLLELVSKELDAIWRAS
jgi:hypothetical protein